MRSVFVSLALLAAVAVAVPTARAIYASPVQAGCYIAAPNDCRIRVDPFVVNLAPGQRLVSVSLLANRMGSGTSVVYDWRPDLSNPAPLSGSTYSPAIPSQDLAAACGQSYRLYLEGQDTGDPNPYNLGATATFTCPSTVP